MPARVDTRDLTRLPIRVGVLCNPSTFQHWHARCLQDLQDLDGVRLALIILDRAPAPARSLLHRVAALPAHPGKLLSRLLLRILCNGRAQSHVHVTSLFPEVPTLIRTPITNPHADQSFTDADIETIRGHDLDFILRLGFGATHGDLVHAARWGVWAFQGDDDTPPCASPCFWAIYRDRAVTEAFLYRLTAQPDLSIVLKTGCFRTETRSYARNSDQICYESAKWPRRVCTDICNDLAGYLNGRPCHVPPSMSHVPTMLQLLSFAGKVMKHRLTFAWQRLARHPQWNIGVLQQPIEAWLDHSSDLQIAWFPLDDTGGFLADPFGIVQDNRIVILCEYFDYHRSKGSICAIDLNGKTFGSEPHGVLALPFHASYPYVVEHGGEVYCIPETSQAREVALFKAEIFPEKWVKQAILLKNVAGLDPTLFHYGARWWLMCTDGDSGPDMNLLVWHAPDLLGPWVPHSGNPVKSDVRSARPAGTPFLYGGQLYRPAQDCSRTYGGRIVLNRVTRLNPREFKEEPAAVIEPSPESPFPDGRHTVSAVGDITLIDGHRFLFVGSALRAFLTIWLRNAFRTAPAGRVDRSLPTRGATTAL